MSKRWTLLSPYCFHQTSTLKATNLSLVTNYGLILGCFQFSSDALEKISEWFKYTEASFENEDKTF